MPRTYTNLLFHLVFATKGRYPFIVKEHRERMYEYIGGTLRSLGAICIEIGGVADHVHIIVKLRPNQDISDILSKLKPSVTKWARANIHPKFEWQDGYGAFTIGESQLPGARKYVLGQEEHHRKTPFDEEFKELLKRAGIEFDEKYLWS